MQGASQYLRELIRAEGGAISVERFMREALYHPTFGYYARKVRRIGAGGDFSTSATLHDALPRALATWATAHRARVKQRDGSWHVIELGGGGGEMAAGFLGALGWLARRRLRYHIVEVSTPLRALQQQKTVRYPGVTHWHATIQEALAAADGRALILSNEFVDAFPCIQLSRNGEGDHSWSEVMVAWPDDSPHPTERLEPCGWPDVNPPPDSSVMRSDFLDAAVSGQRVEIHRSYQQWLAGWVPQWKSGRMLTIDYGDGVSGLYRRQPRGTLRAYARHQRIVGPEIYRNFGLQDLTADVNFTDLQDWGERLGLPTIALSAQSGFLGRWLSKRYLDRAAIDPALAFLLDVVGAGGAFKVLEQVRMD